MNRLAFALAAVVALTACPAQPSSPSTGAGSSASSPDLVLKAYDVPAEQASELQGIINGLLFVSKDAPRKGSAALTPSGQLLVAAPPGFHPGIAEVIAKLKSGPVVAAPTVRIDYWIVGGEPAKEPTAGADVAPEIASVLDALEKNQGPMKLSMLERLSLSSQSGSEASVQGRIFRLDQTAAVHGDKVVAKAFIRAQDGGKASLDSRIEVPLGQTVVLGQAGASLFMGGAWHESTAFYVVRVSVDAK